MLTYNNHLKKLVLPEYGRTIQTMGTHRLHYNTDPARRRHYGRLVELTVAAAADMPPCEERDELLSLVGNQMKKLLLVINPEGVENERVYRDLYEMSDGRIRVDAASLPLHEFNIVAPPTAKKKRKRK